MTMFKSTAFLGLIMSALGAMALSAIAFAPGTDSDVPPAPVESKSNDGLDRNVRIHNQTGMTMVRFYASDSRKNSWEEDILGADVLPSGRSVMIDVDDGSGACVYDFRADFSGGETLERRRINVCQIADYYYKP